MKRHLWLKILAALLVWLAGAYAASLAAQPAAVSDIIFVDSEQYLGGETGNDVALGDLDGDGDPDAFVANDHTTSGEANHIWLNQGSGLFESGPVLGDDNGRGVALGDLDGDGDLDALVATVGSIGFNAPGENAPATPRAPAGIGTTQVWLNQGGLQGGDEGDFAAGASFGSFDAYTVAAGDVDNDGDLDALVAGINNQIWLNDGGAAFNAGPIFPFLFSEDALLDDLDGDGYLDVFIADSANGSANQLWWNDGNWNPGPGTFSAGDQLPTASLIHGAASGNLDDDNFPDLFLAGSSQDVIFWNHGDRTFSAAAPLAVADNSFDVVLGDVDGDADLDAVVANITSEPNRLWRNDGARTFTIGQEFGDETGLFWSRALALADLNGDGAVDLFEVTTGVDRVWFNQRGVQVIPNATGWQRQLVDARGEAGYSPAMALDANDHPHISYGRRFYTPGGDHSYLHYARWDGTRWHKEVVDVDVSETAIAVNAAGHPRIAYTTGGGQTLNYASWNGEVWQLQPAAQVDFPQTLALGALVLDAAGRPHILYHNYSNSSPAPENLYYSYWDGDVWTVEVVEQGLVYDSALAIDNSGNLHLAYAIREDFDAYVVKYARRSAGSWQKHTLQGADAGSGVFVASLALDTIGNPHIAYAVDAFSGNDLLTYARWDGAAWQQEPVLSLQPAHEIRDIALDIQVSTQPRLVYHLVDDVAGAYRIEHAYRDGGDWQVETLDGGPDASLFGDHLVSMALDSAANLHAAYYALEYEDLRYLTWGLNWQVRPLPEPGNVSQLDIAVESNIPSVGYYNYSGGQLKLGAWDDAWSLSPLRFVSQPIADLAVAAGPQYRHFSFHDAGNNRLLYGQWNGADFHLELVDEAGDVGRYNDLVLAGHSDGGPRIAYWDATTRRIKLAIPLSGSPLWNIYPNNAGPGLDANSGPLSASVIPGGMGVAYYDGGRGDLRFAAWSAATTSWSDERVDGASSDAGRLSSLQTDWTEKVPVVAYYDEGQDAIKLAYKTSGGWQIETPVSGLGGVTGLSLQLGYQSRHHARIAYATAGGALNVALRRNGGWQIEVVRTATSMPGGVAMARDERLHLAFTQDSDNLHYAFRSASLDADPLNPGAPPAPPAGDYNPLDPCPAGFLGGGNHPTFNHAPAGASLPLAPAHHTDLGDHLIFDGMTEVFRTTQAGRDYIDLYHHHSAEMAQIGLDNPRLLFDAFGALQNFLPGLEALITGRGDEIVVSQKMVDDALQVWQQLAAAGSPSLAATINQELDKYDDLQDFVGLTFDQWAIAIGVNPPPQRYLLPLFSRP